MPPVLPATDLPFRDAPERFETPFRGNPFPEDPSVTAAERSSNRRDVRQWYLIVQEGTTLFDRGHRVSGQFTPQQVTKNVGDNIPEAAGYGRMSPIIQWVGGKVETFTFQARLFSEHSGDNTAAEKLAEIEYLRESDVTLGRPPLLSFYWGVAIPDGFPCLIESLGQITYDEIRPDRSLRGVTLNITLKRHTPFTFEQVTTTPTARTPVHIVKHGETYEMIAYDHYGDPMLGVLLRQMNPRSPMTKKAPQAVADLSPGEEVRIYPVRDMKNKPIKPLCHVLRTDNRVAADNRRYFFELRSTQIASLPRK